MNDSMLKVVASQYEDFDTKVKIIKQYEYKKLVTVQKSNVNVKKEPFII